MQEEAQQLIQGAKKGIRTVKNTYRGLKWLWISLAFVVSNFLVFLGVCLVLFVSLTIAEQHKAIESEESERIHYEENQIPSIDGDLIFPLDNFRVTCGFTCYANHGGLDMSSGYGANVRAVKNGTVIKVVTGYVSDGGYLGHKGGYGNQVVIQHENGVQTRYAHMMDTIRVSIGDEVVIGQVIGQQGNSGNSSGSHLHFEWIENGAKVDPMTRLPFNQPKPPTDVEQNPTS